MFVLMSLCLRPCVVLVEMQIATTMSLKRQKQRFLSLFMSWLVVYSIASDTPVHAQPALQAFADPTVKSLIEIDPDAAVQGPGEAVLRILPNNDNVQISNYNSNSFILQNTAQQEIVGVFIDVSDAVFSDIVFDDNGSGGDSVAKPLTFNNNRNRVGAIDINLYPWQWLPARPLDFVATVSFDATNPDTYFVDATSDNALSSPQAGGGFRGELLLFQSFAPGLSVGFSGDMDPNSIAGLTKETVDQDANWDVGGVSGSEMIHSMITVLFGDGSIASGRLAPDGSQAGSVAVVSNTQPLLEAPQLVVHGLSPGQSGTYFFPTGVMDITGPPFSIVRVSFVVGFNPVVSQKLVANDQINVRDLVQERLDAQYPEFPCNNAQNWQHSEWLLPASGRLEETIPFVNPDNLPIAFVAVLINEFNGDRPVSHPSDPIRLVHASAPPSSPPCSALNFLFECASTDNCLGLYNGATDCQQNEGGVCFCETAVCGCKGDGSLVPSVPPPTPQVSIPTPPQSPTSNPTSSPTNATTLAPSPVSTVFPTLSPTNATSTVSPTAFPTNFTSISIPPESTVPASALPMTTVPIEEATTAPSTLPPQSVDQPSTNPLTETTQSPIIVSKGNLGSSWSTIAVFLVMTCW